jgi:hypothetical protein
MLYDILKDFKGSQDGRSTEQFSAGTQRELSDYLVSCIPSALAHPAGSTVKIENKAIIEEGTMRRGRPPGSKNK